MNEADLKLLKERIGRYAILRCSDGEVILAEIHSVSEEDQDVIYDVVFSNRSELGKDTKGPAYLLLFSELDSVGVPDQGNYVEREHDIG